MTSENDDGRRADRSRSAMVRQQPTNPGVGLGYAKMCKLNVRCWKTAGSNRARSEKSIILMTLYEWEDGRDKACCCAKNRKFLCVRKTARVLDDTFQHHGEGKYCFFFGDYLQWQRWLFRRLRREREGEGEKSELSDEKRITVTFIPKDKLSCLKENSNVNSDRWFERRFIYPTGIGRKTC